MIPFATRWAESESRAFQRRSVRRWKRESATIPDLKRDEALSTEFDLLLQLVLLPVPNIQPAATASASHKDIRPLVKFSKLITGLESLLSQTSR